MKRLWDFVNRRLPHSTFEPLHKIKNGVTLLIEERDRLVHEVAGLEAAIEIKDRRILELEVELQTSKCTVADWEADFYRREGQGK